MLTYKKVAVYVIIRIIFGLGKKARIKARFFSSLESNKRDASKKFSR